jgi:hypothetical protein
MAYKGKFTPKNPQKYVGDYRNIVYRSSWECKIMDKFDRSPEIVSWQSEEFFIPYVSPVDGRWHRYFPDFLVKHQNGKTYLVEVKPYKQSMPPKQQKRKTKQYIQEVVTWGVNQAKWKAAIEYAKDRKWEFIVMTSVDGIEFKHLTEKDLLLS